MDDLDDLQESEFVTDTDDQDSLDEKIDSEQRVRNQQLWVSFQNAACCITQLYQDRSQPSMSSWLPFQNAAGTLTSLYRDCIESQKRFAKIGYQIGRRKRIRDLNKVLMRRRLNAKNLQQPGLGDSSNHHANNNVTFDADSSNLEQLEKHNHYTNNMSSKLVVNQLNIDCDGTSSISKQNQPDRTSEEYQRHFGSRKRSCTQLGGNIIKRIRE